jgi:hypothetical protein
VAKKFNGSQYRQSPGRPKINEEVEALVMRLAQENRTWGYDRIVGALAHLGYTISDQTVGNILTRHGIPPAPARSPNLNAYAERWVRSVKGEALSRLILFGERSLRRALTEYVAHYHEERPHQGKGNVVLFPGPRQGG